MIERIFIASWNLN